jgi:prepilin-type N-terminal cleavage/methylation domain-containing protein
MNYRVSFRNPFRASRKPFPSSGSGFTLIELLVVIAIMGILIALLVGYSGNSLKAGRKATAISNLRSISMAAISLASDSDGIVDLNDSEGGTYKQYATLGGLLVERGLLGDRSLLISPELSELRRREFMSVNYPWKWRTFGIVADNPKNPGLFKPEGTSGGAAKSGLALRLAAVEKPASYPLMVDTCGLAPANGQSANEMHSSWVCFFNSGITSWKPVLRDGKTLLLSFADGHVEAAELPRIREVVSSNFAGTNFTVMGPLGISIPLP